MQKDINYLKVLKNGNHLTLDDLEYSKSDFDDDNWDKIEVNKKKGFFNIRRCI